MDDLVLASGGLIREAEAVSLRASPFPISVYTESSAGANYSATMTTKEPVQDEVARYLESIERRVPATAKICDDYRRAETEYVDRREHRAFVEKRLKERMQYLLRLKKRYNSSSNWNHKWSGGQFTVLASRARILAERAEEHVLSPRVRELVTAIICDCELVVRYFEKRVESIQRNKSEHQDEGRRVSRQLRAIFPGLRDLISFYAYNVVPLESTQLQQMTVDGLHCKHLQEKVKRGVDEIRGQMGEPRDAISSGHTESQPDCRMGGWPTRWLQPYTWRLSQHHRARVEQLCTACEEGDTKQVSLLLKNGTYVNGTGAAKVTPLVYAVRNSRIEIIQLLIEHGANTDGVLLEAVEMKNLATVEALLADKDGVYINTRSFSNPSRHGITALCRAAELGLPDIVYLLLTRGADWGITYCDHTTDLHKISALHVAKGLCASHIHTISETQEDYFAASAKDSKQRIPLFWALERQDWTAIPMCDPHWTSRAGAVDVDGNNVLHEVCKVLANCSDSSREAISAMDSAISHNGDKVRSANHEGTTPMQMLAAVVAAAGSKESGLLVACKKAIFTADLYLVTRKTHPEDYFEDHVVYCFGTRPEMTEKEWEERQKQWKLREEHEAEVKKEQEELFNRLVRECK